jgi:prepilin-type processing-associated H-X9-DG protein
MSDYYGFVPNWCVTHPCMTAPPNPKDAPSAPGAVPPDMIITWDLSISPSVSGEWSTYTCRNNPKGVDCRAYAITQYTQFSVGGNLWGTSETYIPNPSATVLYYEKGANLIGSWGDALGQNLYETHNGALKVEYDPGATTPYMNEYGQEIDCRPFHRGGKNMVYVDGHAKFHKYGTGPFDRKGVSVVVSGYVGDFSDLP